MDRERYIELDNSGTGLTKEEWEAGWHWCNDWDGMLVGPGCDEADCCNCGIPAIEEWKKSPEAQARIAERYPEIDDDDPLKYFEKL